MKKYGKVSPSRRVQLKEDGKYRYIVGWDARGGCHMQDKPEPSRPGKVAYLVSKSRHGRGGAAWYSRDALRFTKRRGR